MVNGVCFYGMQLKFFQLSYDRYHHHITMPSDGLRQRKAALTAAKSEKPATAHVKSREDIVWGQTPGGEGKLVTYASSSSVDLPILVFRVPTTHDVITTLLNPSYPKSDFDILNLGLLGLQIVLYLLFSRGTAQIFFICYFAFWRAAYDAGLGWVLTKQSKKKWIVKEVQRLGWLDATRRPAMRDWIQQQLVGKMGKDYSFDVGLTRRLKTTRQLLNVWG